MEHLDMMFSGSESYGKARLWKMEVKNSIEHKWELADPNRTTLKQ